MQEETKRRGRPPKDRAGAGREREMQAKNEALLAKINEMRAEVDEVRTMSVEEAAARLGVSTALVRAEIAAGRLSYCPMGRLIRITVKDLREYLDRIRTRRPIPEADQEPE